MALTKTIMERYLIVWSGKQARFGASPQRVMAQCLNVEDQLSANEVMSSKEMVAELAKSVVAELKADAENEETEVEESTTPAVEKKAWQKDFASLQAQVQSLAAKQKGAS